MIPVLQTKFGVPDGNCFAACVASIFECGINDIADHCGANDAESWNKVWDKFLVPRNIGMLSFDKFSPGWAPKGYVIAAIVSPRFPDSLHACVALDGTIIHDPHPDGTGIGKPVTEWTIFYPINPAEPMRIGSMEVVR